MSMRKPRWICQICEQTFSRGWNANRHCKNQHGEIPNAVMPFNFFANRSSVSFDENSNTLQNINTLSHNDIFFQNNLQSNVKQDMKSNEFPNYFEREVMLTDRLEELAPKYEEIEEILTGLPEHNKRWLLGHIVISAVTSDNPSDYISSQLKMWRKAKTCNFMLNNAAICLGVDKNLAKDLLKLVVK